MVLFERGAFVYRSLASLKLVHNVKGDQSSLGQGRGGVGSVLDRRKTPV